MPRRSLSLLTVPAVLAAAAPASGAVRTFGSTLSLPVSSSLTQTHGQDTAFWSTRLSGGARASAPASGQILAVRVKGKALGGTRLNRMIHFQALRRVSGSRMRVIVTTQGFTMPSGGSPNRVTTFRPTNFCVRRGDYVDFNTVGGFQPPAFPRGIPFRIFAQAPGARTLKYTMGDGTNNGATLRGSTNGNPGRMNVRYPNPSTAGAELLMQMRLGTGRHATALCPGGTRR